MKEEIIKLIQETYQNVYGAEQDSISKMVVVPTANEMGDYSLPCFSFAKELKKSPVQIAAELKEELQKHCKAPIFDHAEAVNGYLNVFLNQEAFSKWVLEEASHTNYGAQSEGQGKTICMDYSSPNIAKNFHVGHLRTTLIGNSLYHIFTKMGYQVVRINHLGDWGTQFGKLIVAYKKWSCKEWVEEKGIEELLRIYVKFGTESEKNPELNEEARIWFSKMEQGDKEALAIWKWFKEISMIEFERVYKLLNVAFDSYAGESFYMDKVPALVKELEEKQLLVESDGAEIVDLSEEGMPPCLIMKKDGSSIYHSRDLAAVLYRKKTYQFNKCLYITGMEQQLHFAQVFAVIKKMGYQWSDELVHIPYGLVSLNGAKLSSRNGTVIYAEDILEEAVKRAKAMMEEKNPNLDNKDKVAGIVGIGAVIFHDLFNQRIKNVNFSWDEILNFDGATGPYIQYTYARAKSILRKAVAQKKEEGANKENQCSQLNEVIENYSEDVNHLAFTESSAYEVIKQLAEYKAVIQEASKRYEPCVIARYVYSLSNAFNKFYQDCPILSASEEVKEARLFLVDVVQKVIKDAMALLGIECPEAM